MRMFNVHMVISGINVLHNDSYRGVQQWLAMAMTYIYAIIKCFHLYSLFRGYSPMLHCHRGIYSEINY